MPKRVLMWVWYSSVLDLREAVGYLYRQGFIRDVFFSVFTIVFLLGIFLVPARVECD
jgi:hypothetical protein